MRNWVQYEIVITRKDIPCQGEVPFQDRILMFAADRDDAMHTIKRFYKKRLIKIISARACIKKRTRAVVGRALIDTGVPMHYSLGLLP